MLGSSTVNGDSSISDRAHHENWTSHQHIGAIAQDSVNINSKIEHNYVSNTLKGGDESHCIAIATLSRIFNVMAQKVKDAQSSDDDEQENSPTLVVQQNSILDNLLLAEEHLVFKFSSSDPGVKCSKIVASVNVAKIMSSIITAIMISLWDLLPRVGLEIGMATSDAAGCNWISFQDTLSTHTFQGALPCEILNEYSKVDFDVRVFDYESFSRCGLYFCPTSRISRKILSHLSSCHLRRIRSAI